LSRAEEFKVERARGTEQCLSGAGEGKFVNGFHFPFKSGVGSLSIAFSG
jgi:hypothetical protein